MINATIQLTAEPVKKILTKPPMILNINSVVNPNTVYNATMMDGHAINVRNFFNF